MIDAQTFRSSRAIPMSRVVRGISDGFIGVAIVEQFTHS